MLVTPLMDWGGQSRQPRRSRNAGNVLEPRPAGEAVHGQWGRRWLRVVPAALAAGSGAAVVAVRRARR